VILANSHIIYVYVWSGRMSKRVRGMIRWLHTIFYTITSCWVQKSRWDRNKNKIQVYITFDRDYGWLLMLTKGILLAYLCSGMECNSMLKLRVRKRDDFFRHAVLKCRLLSHLPKQTCELEKKWQEMHSIDNALKIIVLFAPCFALLCCCHLSWLWLKSFANCSKTNFTAVCKKT
jgi:hypothetical protein